MLNQTMRMWKPDLGGNDTAITDEPKALDAVIRMALDADPLDGDVPPPARPAASEVREPTIKLAVPNALAVRASVELAVREPAELAVREPTIRLPSTLPELIKELARRSAEQDDEPKIPRRRGLQVALAGVALLVMMMGVRWAGEMRANVRTDVR